MAGIYYHKGINRWQASVRFGGKPFHVGSFKTKELAEAAQQDVEKQLEAAGEGTIKSTALERLLDSLEPVTEKEIKEQQKEQEEKELDQIEDILGEEEGAEK